MKLLVKTLAGLEGVLARELDALGAKKVEPLVRAVACEGDLTLLYRANLELRSALRVLLPLAAFRVRNEDELYREIGRIDWSVHMDVDDTLAVDAVSNSQQLPHSKYVALKTKDAIVDQFRRRHGRRPSVDVKAPTLRINVHVWREQCTVSLDSSGDSLHKRGYRTQALAAPINEVLAAGMILLSDWRRDGPFLDPMCGSGTILIEAALFAHHIPPQLHREHFGFMRWKTYDADRWNAVHRQARQAVQPFDHPLLGYDRDFGAVKVAQHNALAAHLEGKVHIERQRFERLEPPLGAPGLMMMNPPYDERMGAGNINVLYSTIGDRLKQHFPGYEAWIISSNKEALKHVGLRPSKKITLYNGALECKFQKYELYRGSRKGAENGASEEQKKERGRKKPGA